MSNLEAAQSGDQLRALEQARDTAAAAIDLAQQRGDGTVAQLIAQYRGVLAEIATLKAGVAPVEVSDLDRIRAQRATRSDSPADHPRTPRRRKSSNG